MRDCTPLFFFLLSLLFFAGGIAAAGYSLTVITQGDGYVSSTPAGILCGAACIETFDAGREIWLQASAKGFKSWSGACSGTQITCTLTMDGPKIVTATFSGTTYSEYELTVYKSGDGSGTVSSDPYGITLGTVAPYDSIKFQSGTSVTLTATASAGSRFDGWSGACSGKQSTCVVTMNAAQQATTTFSKTGSPAPTTTPSPTPSKQPQPATTPAPSATPTRTSKPIETPKPETTFQLTILKSGAGRGALYVWPSGRSQELCGASDKDCTLEYPSGTQFTFQTLPVPDSQFEGWSGACQGTEACSITLDGDKQLTAIFEPATIQKASHENPVVAPPLPIVTPPPTPPYIPRGTPTPLPQAEFPLIVQVSGKGTIQSSDKRINCGPQGSSCEASFARYNQVPLAAYPAPGWSFAGWGGECRQAEGPGCTVTIEGSSFAATQTLVRAVFQPGLKTLTVQMEGDGWVRSVDHRISCGKYGYNCVGQYPIDSTAQLNAQGGPGSTFERWEGACNHSYPDCAVTLDEVKSVKAVFKGPPTRKKLTVQFPKHVGAKLLISSYEFGNSPVPVQRCESNCTFDFKHGTKLYLQLLEQKYGFIWEGFGGACMGTSGNCQVVMDADRTLTLSYSKSSFKKLTVVQPEEGRVALRDYYEKLRCGSGYNECTVEMDIRETAVLQFDVSGGLFDSGCTSIVKRFNQYHQPYEECLVNMSQDHTVKTKISPEKIKWIIGTALGEAFDIPDYPGLKAFVLQEEGQPFQHALGAYNYGYTGGRKLDDVRNWLRKNWDAIIQNNGVGQYMKDYDLRIVRSALFLTFNADIEAYKYKYWFKYTEAQNYIYLENSPPVKRAMREWFGMRKKPIPEFDKHVKDNKQSYYVNEGIEAFFKEPPQATPTPKPKINTDPFIEIIRPDNDQMTKPVTVSGYHLNGIREVRIDGLSLEVGFIDDHQFRLPTVQYGRWPQFGAGSTMTIVTDRGTFNLPITKKHMYPGYKNADGKEERCFGAIGKGCFGLDGKDKGDEATNTDDRGGCLAVKKLNGVPVRECFVSAGSIKHDNCCALNAGGKWCGGPGTDGKPAEEWNHNGKCADEWNDAFWDSFWIRNWKETFYVSKGGLDLLTPYPSPNKRYSAFEGERSASICAPKGTKMREDKDAPFCCSGKIDFWRDCK